MNDFERCQRKRIEQFENQQLKQKLAFMFNEYYLSHQCFLVDDTKFASTMDELLKNTLGTLKLSEKRKQEIIRDAITLTKINYDIVLISKEPLMFEKV